MKEKVKRNKTEDIVYIKIPSQEELLARVVYQAVKSYEKLKEENREGIAKDF